LGNVVEDVDLIFNDRREHENGNTLVVRNLFEGLGDGSIFVPQLCTQSTKTLNKKD